MVSFSTFNLANYTWQNRFAWSGVFQQVERALNGAQHVEPTVVTQGRPITLTCAIEDFSVFNDLANHALATQTEFTLTINGTDFTVIWLHEPVAVNGEPVINFSDAEPSHMQNVKLNFITTV